MSLHLAALVFVPGCAVAAWWQINRAADGNQLSYLYSVMWPVFGLLGIAFWWMLSTPTTTASGSRACCVRSKRRRKARRRTPPPSQPAGAPTPPPTVSADDDPELAAYNARLAELAAEGPKTWRNTETVVARRPQ